MKHEDQSVTTPETAIFMHLVSCMTQPCKLNTHSYKWHFVPTLCDGNEMSAQKLTIATTEYFHTSKHIAAYKIAAMQHKLNF